jgi:DNA-binding response OmpR family regulator
MNNFSVEKMIIAVTSNNQNRLTTILNDIKTSGIKAQGYLDSMTLFKKMLTKSINLLIMDLDLSIEDESSVERYLAINPDLLCIIIASGNAPINKQIAFLNSGADKVLVHPVDNSELVANVIALIRTGNKNHQITQPLNNESLWILNSFDWTLSAPNQKSIPLSVREYKLIQMLASRPSETINKHFIAEKILGKFNQNGSRRMDLLVGRLRNKALYNLQAELPIKTVHSIGYALACNITIK